MNEGERLRPEKVGNTDHRAMKVGLFALGGVRHERELGYAQDFALYVFDVCLPHVARGIRERPQG
jgi:hypothetical protein